MDTIELWARNGEAVRQAIELGELVHLETASEELTDEFLLFAIESGLSQKWAEAFPDPREKPEIGMEVMLPAHRAGRFAALYSFRKTGYVLRSAGEFPKQGGEAPWRVYQNYFRDLFSLRFGSLKDDTLEFH